MHEGIAEELRVASGAGQVASRDNEVRVAIVDGYGDARGLNDIEFLFHGCKKFLGSVITPVMAEAATVRGDARIVRAPGP